MTLHKLSAGSGYEYLTRQVAALDSTEKGRSALADYYSAKGESPGRWVGSGLVGIDGLEVGDAVTAEQMKHLFCTGSHPLTGQPLGAAYKVYDNTGVDGFNAEVARRLAALTSTGSTGEVPRPPYDILARVRSEVARERFVAEQGREPPSARELSDALARYSRPRQTPVAGYDLTFSPVKSVSALWAIAPREVAEAIEAAHNAAVRDALAFIEREVLFTREGRNGARQVETRGLIATAFRHRDSRAGDPDLHTHVAVANKVQTQQGKWLSIFGKVLHEHVVAASETYNTALERRLTEAFGVQFAERLGTPRDKRPVRELEGVDRVLCERWSQRRSDIVTRQRELSREFNTSHGRPPTLSEAVALAQQANLETREAKHEPRSYAEQRTSWRAQAVIVLGSEQALARMVSTALHPAPRMQRQVTATWVRETAARVVAELEGRRATWQIRELNLRAQAARRLVGATVRLSDDCEAHVGDIVITRRNNRRLGVSGTDWVKNGDRWIVTGTTDGSLSVRHRDSGLHATLPAAYVAAHAELGYASTIHTAQGLTADVMHGLVTGEESRQTLYTMLTRGRVENHVHVVLADIAEDHVLPSPSLERQATATELLEGILARDGAAFSATTARAVGASPEAELQDAVTRYTDALTLAASKVRVDLDDAPSGPLPWLAGVPDELVTHPAWGPYLSARSRRVGTLTDKVRTQATSTLPEWTRRYDNILTPELRDDLAIWRAATGVRPDDRSLAGPVPDDDHEAAYHRHLVRTINARYGDALKVWETRIVDYVGKRDEQTIELAKHLDTLQRRGIEAERVLDLAAARKPLPSDHPTSALAYRVRELVTPKKRRPSPTIDPLPRAPQRESGPSLGL